jgi:tetratricopeptide (TPR) repeat protein
MERFEASLALEPEQPAVLLAVANARARQGRLVEALAIYDRLLEIGPESPPAILEKRAVVLVNLDRGEEAIAAFEQAVAAAPNDLALRQRFVEALEFLGQAQRAAAERAALAPLERSGGESTDVLVREAFRLREEGRDRDAIERYRRALAHSPQRSDVRFGLASLLLDMGDHAGAADEFRQLLEEAPRHAAARRGRVLALVLDGRYPVARAELQEALRLFPRDRELALMQVRLLASAPDPRARDGALALEIARLVHDDDRGETTREALALAYAAAGDFEEAVALQQVLVAEADRAGTPAVAESRRARLAAFQRSQTWQARSPEEIAGGVRP